MDDFDHVNACLSGAPLWERIKADTIRALAAELNRERVPRAPTVDVIAPVSAPAPADAPASRGYRIGRPGREPDPSSCRQRGIAMARAGIKAADIRAALGINMTYAYKLVRLANGGRS